MSRSANTNRLFLLLAGIVVAIFIAWLTQRMDKVKEIRSTTQKVNTNKMSNSLPGIFGQSGSLIKEIIRIVAQ